jgi:hypothetical protein
VEVDVRVVGGLEDALPQGLHALGGGGHWYGPGGVGEAQGQAAAGPAGPGAFVQIGRTYQRWADGREGGPGGRHG